MQYKLAPIKKRPIKIHGAKFDGMDTQHCLDMGSDGSSSSRITLAFITVQRGPRLFCLEKMEGGTEVAPMRHFVWAPAAPSRSPSNAACSGKLKSHRSQPFL